MLWVIYAFHNDFRVSLVVVYGGIRMWFLLKENILLKQKMFQN